MSLMCVCGHDSHGSDHCAFDEVDEDTGESYPCDCWHFEPAPMEEQPMFAMSLQHAIDRQIERNRGWDE